MSSKRRNSPAAPAFGLSLPGVRRVETLVLLGLKPELVPDNGLMDGINAGRLTIPHARFDQTKTAKGLDCLREYSTDWDEKAHTFKVTPKHNWASHGADAWRYLSLAWRAPMRPAEPPPPPLFPGLNEIAIDDFMRLEEESLSRRVVERI